MRRVLIFICFVVLGCDSDSAWDCIQSAGNITQVTIDVQNFEKIKVNRDIELIITEGPEYIVMIESGENLINDIEARVIDGRLELTDNNTCNFVRDYGLTRIFVHAPNLTEIRNSSQYEVSSNGVLNYDQLVLTSEDFNEPDSFTVGDFRMELNSTQVQIVSNNISSYFLSGSVQNLNIGFFSGSGRFEGAELIAENINIFHRGSNEMVINPQQSLSGELRSTGDVISLNRPDDVTVQEFYTGRLIFVD